MANDIKLQEGHPVDKNLRPIKVGGKSTAIETAQQGNGARITGDLEVNGTTMNIHATGGDVVLKNIISDGDIVLDAVSEIIRFRNGNNDMATLSAAGGSNTALTLYEDGGATTDDYCIISTAANGATVIFTLDDAGTDADLLLDVDGDITLDSATGKFIAKENGNEFSVANSAYAGMILGYTMIGEDAAHASYTMTTSYVVPDAAMTVRFEAPPSGNVEVMVQVFFDGGMNRQAYLGLSDNATYNTIGAGYEQATGMADETDNHVHQHYWAITGLTAGATYNYWLGAKANGGYISWGGTASGRFCDFIMKVTALPEATANYAVYD